MPAALDMRNPYQSHLSNSILSLDTFSGELHSRSLALLMNLVSDFLLVHRLFLIGGVVVRSQAPCASQEQCPAYLCCSAQKCTTLRLHGIDRRCEWRHREETRL